MDYADDAAFGLTISDRGGNDLILQFQWDSVLEEWLPVFAPHEAPATLGADLEPWVQRTETEGKSALLPSPLDPLMTQLPHDDVTVATFPENGAVVLFLWKDGEVSSLHYTVAPSESLRRRAEDARRRDGNANEDDGESAGAGPGTFCYFMDCLCFAGHRLIPCLIANLLGCADTCLP